MTGKDEGNETRAGVRPVSGGERIVAVDVVRGFAVLGILLVNIYGFSGLLLSPQSTTDRLDRLVMILVILLAQAKFYSLFSFLFGWGMSIQLKRAARRGASFVRLYLRRMLILLLIGLFHGVFLWSGDILTTYAVLGTCLLLFRKTTSRKLLIWVGLFLLLAIVAVLPGQAMDQLRDLYAEITGFMRVNNMPPQSIYADGSFLEIVPRHMGEFFGSQSWFIYWLGNVFAMMLLGLYAGRRRLLQDVDGHLPLIRRTLWSGLVIGLIFNAIAVWVTVDSAAVAAEHQRFVRVSARTIGAPALMLFYASGLVLLMRREAWRRRLMPLASVGRMALSNYLLQSVVVGLLFYGYGLGLYGRITPTVALIIVIVTYLAQIRISQWWMERYRFGPAEWLWRTLTYGRRQPLRREHLTFVSQEPSRLSAWLRPLANLDRRIPLLLVWVLLIAWASGLVAWNSRLDSQAGQSAITLFSHEAPAAPATVPATPTPMRPVAAAPASEVLATPVVRPVEYRPLPEALAGDVQAMTAAIDVDRALEHINMLAGPAYDGRLAGSDGGRAAGDYIAEKFAQYGLQPASLDGTYFQTFPITYTTLTGMPRLQISYPSGYPDGSSGEPYTLYEHYSPLVGGYAGGGQGSGPVHWVNQCRAEDFADLKLLDKIVFCRPEPNNDALTLSSRLALEYGAAGLLLLTDEAQRPADFASRHQELWVPETIPVLRVYPPVAQDLLAGSGLTVEELLRADAPQDLQTAVTMSVQTSASTRVESRNVLGVLPGRDSDFADEVIVVGAHYDHMGSGPDGTVWAGANDNASGVAAILEIARSWQVLGFVPQRTVLFAAWDAEEWGLIGSRHYVEHPSYPLESTLASFQLDMVGAGPGQLAISGDGELAQQQLNAAAYLDVEAMAGNLGRSDHVPFLEAGVPATLLIWRSETEPNNHYHRPADEPAVIEPERLDAVLKVADTALLDLVESVPALEQLVERRAAAAANQNLADFLSTSGPNQVTTDGQWFADLQSLAPQTVTLSLADAVFQGGLATADITIDVTHGPEDDHLRLTQPVHFSHGAAGWRWAGPALSWYEPSGQDLEAAAVETRVTIGYPLDVEEDQAPLAAIVAALYDRVSARLALPGSGQIRLMLLPDEEAIRFSSRLSTASEQSVRIEPGLAQLVYRSEISRTQQLEQAIIQIVLADAGISEQSAPWLWDGLPIAWRASLDLRQVHGEHLPALSMAFAAGEPPPEAAGSWAAVEYLIQTLGWEGLGRFIQEFGQACTTGGCETAAGLDQAMIAALQMDLDAFNAAWLAHWRSHMDQVQVNLDRLLLERTRAVLEGDKPSFLATIDGANPNLTSSESAWFDRHTGIPLANLAVTAQPIANFANGDILATVTLDYATEAPDGEPQQGQAVIEVLFTAAGDGYQWAGVADKTMTGDLVTIRYPDGQMELARQLLSEAEASYARLADILQVADRQPAVLELYPDRDSFRIAIGLEQATSGWLPSWSAPGAGIKLQRQGDDTVASYRPALAYQLARHLLYQLGIRDEWLLKGIASQLSITLGNRETLRTLNAALLELSSDDSGDVEVDLSSIPTDESLSNPAWLTQAALAWDSMNYLVAREGWPAVLAFLNRVAEPDNAEPGAAQPGALPRAFGDIFGESLADFESEWRASSANNHVARPWIEAIDNLDGELALDHVRFLGGEALAGRQAGTLGAEIAAGYIARRFAEYGLQPAGDLYPDSYLQTFPITFTERLGEPRLDILADPAPYHFRRDFLSLYSTLDASPAQGELVWLGTADDIDLDLQGQIAVAMADDNAGTLLESAQAKHAAGLLLLGFKHEPTELYAKQPLGPAILADIPVLELTRDGTLRLMELLDLRYDTIQELPAGTPLEVRARLASAVATREQVRTANVLGFLPGSDPLLGQQVIIIGAHYDHVGDDPPGLCENPTDCPSGARYSGQNDNASGVAMLLEIARFWQEIGYQPKYGVLFAAWGAQEGGQLGSNHYVREPALPLANTIAVLQLDGLGGGDGFYPGLNAQPEADSTLIQYVTAAAALLEEKIVHVPSPGQSDHLPFGEQGIPAALVSWRLANENNLPDELANRVSPERMAISGRIAALALMMMAR